MSEHSVEDHLAEDYFELYSSAKKLMIGTIAT